MNAPERIAIDSKALTLHWPDGSTRRIAHHVLRHVCPCAECKRQRLDGAQSTVPDDIAVLEIRPAGYGVQLVFNDQHERGIFPWAFLAQLPTTS